MLLRLGTWSCICKASEELCASELDPDSVAYAAVISAFEFMDLQQAWKTWYHVQRR